MNGDTSSDYLSLSQAARELPGRPHISTLHRWRQRGVSGVKLQTCVVGGRRYTTREWLLEFQVATTAARDGQRPDPQPFGNREADILRAERELEQDGVVARIPSPKITTPKTH
jgi:hypothetical protein